MNDAILLHDFEAAELVRMPTRRLVRLAKAGRCPCVILPDSEVRFRESDLLAWVESHRRPAADEAGGGAT